MAEDLQRNSKASEAHFQVRIIIGYIKIVVGSLMVLWDFINVYRIFNNTITIL